VATNDETPLHQTVQLAEKAHSTIRGDRAEKDRFGRGPCRNDARVEHDPPVVAGRRVVVVVLIVPDDAIADLDMQVARLELVILDHDRVLLGHFTTPLAND
jgi:hypothetical protein